MGSLATPPGWPGMFGGIREMTQNNKAASGRRALVTGATGLLGSHLAERLAARGDPRPWPSFGRGAEPSSSSRLASRSSAET